MDKIRRYFHRKKGSDMPEKVSISTELSTDKKKVKRSSNGLSQKPPIPIRKREESSPEIYTRRKSLPRVTTPTRPLTSKGMPTLNRRSRSQDAFSGLPPIDNKNVKSILKTPSNSDENLNEKREQPLSTNTSRPRPKARRVSRSLENVYARIATSLPQGSKLFEEAMEELRPSLHNSLEDLESGGSVGERQSRKRVRVEQIFLHKCYSLPGSPKTYPKQVHWDTSKA